MVHLRELSFLWFLRLSSFRGSVTLFIPPTSWYRAHYVDFSRGLGCTKVYRAHQTAVHSGYLTPPQGPEDSHGPTTEECCCQAWGVYICFSPTPLSLTQASHLLVPPSDPLLVLYVKVLPPRKGHPGPQVGVSHIILGRNMGCL